jgi:hypothetical protein
VPKVAGSSLARNVNKATMFHKGATLTGDIGSYVGGAFGRRCDAPTPHPQDVGNR